MKTIEKEIKKITYFFRDNIEFVFTEPKEVIFMPYENQDVIITRNNNTVVINWKNVLYVEIEGKNIYKVRKDVYTT